MPKIKNWEKTGDLRWYQQTNKLENGTDEGVTVNVYEGVREDGWYVGISKSPLAKTKINEKNKGPFRTQEKARTWAVKWMKQHPNLSRT